jgi:hypothetical protein
MASWNPADAAKRALGWVVKGAQFMVFYPGVWLRYAQGQRGQELLNPFSKEAGIFHIPPGPERPRRYSPHYGADALSNPRSGSTPLPIPYGNGWKTTPLVLQESIEPGALGGGNAVPAAKEVVVRALYAVGEGPIDPADGITDIRVNGTPILGAVREDVDCGKGNGTKKAFELPDDWVFLPGLVVKVDGTAVTLISKTETLYPTMPARGNSLEPITRSSRSERILEDTTKVFVGAVEQSRTGSDYPWALRKVSARKMVVTFQSRPPDSKALKVTYDYVSDSGCQVQQDVKGKTQAVFAAGPATGAKVTATYRRMQFPRLRFEWRPGTLDQDVIQGFTRQRNSFAPSSTGAAILLAKNPAVLPTHKTEPRDVDDMVLVFTAPYGFIAYNDDGDQKPVKVKLTIDYRAKGASQWKQLRHAGGTEFILAGQTTARRTWFVSVRDTLRRRAEAGDLEAVQELEDFARGSYELRVNRLDVVKADSDPSFMDRVFWTFVTHVVDIPVVNPGTILLALEYVSSEALNGGGNLVTCVVRKGTLYDPRTAGGSRDIGQGENLGLILLDFLTSGRGKWKERYGGGHWWSEADLEVSSTARGTLMALADWCDEWVYTETSDRSKPASATNGERRSRLAPILDTPDSILETVAGLCSLAQASAVLQGVRWRFILDRDEDSMGTFVDGLDPAAANIVEGSFSSGPEPGPLPTEVVVRFFDKDLNYGEAFVSALGKDVAEGTPPERRNLEARGMYRPTEATRLAIWALTKARKEPVLCGWDSHPGRIEFEAGDVVTLSVRAPGGSGSVLKVRILEALRNAGGHERMTLRFAGRVMTAEPYTAKTAAVQTAQAQGMGRSTSSSAGGAGLSTTSGGSQSGLKQAAGTAVLSLKAKVLS